MVASIVTLPTDALSIFESANQSLPKSAKPFTVVLTQLPSCGSGLTLLGSSNTNASPAPLNAKSWPVVFSQTKSIVKVLPSPKSLKLNFAGPVYSALAPVFCRMPNMLKTILIAIIRDKVLFFNLTVFPSY